MAALNSICGSRDFDVAKCVSLRHTAIGSAHRSVRDYASTKMSVTAGRVARNAFMA